MTIVEYVVCPLCGSSHPFSSEARRRRRGSPYWQWVDYRMREFQFIQLRDARGKVPGRHPDRRGRGSAPGQGIPKVDYIVLTEAARNPAYRQHIETFRERILSLIRELVELNILSRDEILRVIG